MLLTGKSGHVRKNLFVEQYTLVTPLSREAILETLIESAEPMDDTRLALLALLEDNNTGFEATTSFDSFQCRKIGSARTSWLALAKGQIYEDGPQTRLRIRIRPSVMPFLFHMAWRSVTIAVGLIIFWVGLTRDPQAFPYLLFPWGMLLLHIRSLSFRSECIALRSFLAGILEAREE